MGPLSVINDEDLRFETNPKMLPHPPGILVGQGEDVLAGCLAQVEDEIAMIVCELGISTADAIGSHGFQ